MPNLNRFHLHSGKNIDFFYVGYGVGSVPKSWDTNYKTLPKVEGVTWSYSDSAFESVRKEVTDASTWRYSGGCDLLLANALFGPPVTTLDLRTAIDLKLDEMVNIGAITSVEVLFGRLFERAEDSAGQDTSWSLQ